MQQRLSELPGVERAVVREIYDWDAIVWADGRHNLQPALEQLGYTIRSQYKLHWQAWPTVYRLILKTELHPGD